MGSCLKGVDASCVLLLQLDGAHSHDGTHSAVIELLTVDSQSESKASEVFDFQNAGNVVQVCCADNFALNIEIFGDLAIQGGNPSHGLVDLEHFEVLVGPRPQIVNYRNLCLLVKGVLEVRASDGRIRGLIFLDGLRFVEVNLVWRGSLPIAPENSPA